MRQKQWQWWVGLGGTALVCLAGCTAAKSDNNAAEGDPASEQPASDPGDWGDGPMRFAVIGDFGDDGLASTGIGGEPQVAELIESWNVHFVVTAGDNNYPNGAASTIDANIASTSASSSAITRGNLVPVAPRTASGPHPVTTTGRTLASRRIWTTSRCLGTSATTTCNSVTCTSSP